MHILRFYFVEKTIMTLHFAVFDLNNHDCLWDFAQDIYVGILGSNLGNTSQQGGIKLSHETIFS